MVDFKLTEDQLEMQNLFRKFAQEQILPIAEEMDEKEEMNMDMVKQMMELGFFGVPFSEEVGGTGMDYLTYCLLMEEVASPTPVPTLQVQSPPLTRMAISTSSTVPRSSPPTPVSLIPSWYSL